MLLALVFKKFSFKPFAGGVEWVRRETIFAQICGICLLEQLCFTVFTVPCFGILSDFPSFRLLGFGVIFRRSAVPRFHLLGFGVIFRPSAVPRFCLLGFGVIFRDSAVPSFRLLESPMRRQWPTVKLCPSK